jgi:hypothetical protein
VGKRTHEDAETLSKPSFQRWITGTEVISSISGMVIVAMAVMGAAGVTLKVPPNYASIEVSAAAK